MDQVETIALLLGVAWATGLNLYAAVPIAGELWTTLTHPWFFLTTLAIYLAAATYMLPKLPRSMNRLSGELLDLIKSGTAPTETTSNRPS